MQERKILWLEWRDPLKPLATACRPLVEEGEDPLEVAEARESWGNVLRTGFVEDPISPTGDVGVGIITQMGIFPLHESNIPSKIFRFWTAHTNFVIGERELRAIKYAPGVEAVDVISPYRARVAIGLAFNEAEVKEGILKSVRSVGKNGALRMVERARAQR